MTQLSLVGLSPMATVERQAAIGPQKLGGVSTCAPTEGQSLKAVGMARAASNRTIALRYAQNVAVRTAKALGRPITIDDVFHYAILIDPKSLGNAAGMVFKGEQWEPVGFVQSTRPTNRARIVRTWRLR